MAKIKVITIERQYCSGGGDIGKMVAKNLGINCYDYELVEMAAKRSGIAIDEVQKFEEAVLNPLKTPFYLRTGIERKLDLAEEIFAAQAKVITEIAQNESCVIVGRCADHILRNVVPILSVYIYASERNRAAHAMDAHDVPFEEVDNVLKKNDKKRAYFYNINTTKNWSSMHTYDLCLNSERLGYDGCAKIITGIVEDSE